MWRTLQPGSSPVDWCEGNYLITPLIAEFVNTLSNVLFFLLPPVLIHLFQDYGRFVNRGIHVVWGLLIVVGLSSAYFHATLSLVGQLLDELAIIWVFMAAFYMWFPKRFFPGFFNNNRKILGYVSIVMSVIASGLACINPVANAFALMILGILACSLLVVELKRCSDCRVFRLGIRCALVWVLSVVCWVSDRLYCDVWAGLNFPYLHALWHVFIFISSYTACVLFAFFSVRDELPDQVPILKYWPRDDFELGVPYITFKSVAKLDKHHQI